MALTNKRHKWRYEHGFVRAECAACGIGKRYENRPRQQHMGHNPAYSKDVRKVVYTLADGSTTSVLPVCRPAVALKACPSCKGTGTVAA